MEELHLELHSTGVELEGCLCDALPSELAAGKTLADTDTDRGHRLRDKDLGAGPR